MKAAAGIRLFVAGVVFAAVCGVCAAGDWPRFRGPNGQGVAEERSFAAKWDDSDYAWKIKLPGTGPSSPAVRDGKVFVTCTDAKAPTGMLLAFEAATGKELWRKEYQLKAAKMNSLNSYATCTPAAAADGVYVLWSTENEAIVAGLDPAGKELFTKTYGPTESSHGPGVSAAVVDDMIVFTHEQARGEKGQWIALDRKTGEQRWVVERDNGPISYMTPCLRDAGGGRQWLIFMSTAHGVTAVEPASGQIAWEVRDAFVPRVVSSPVLCGQLIVGSCGTGGGGKRITAVRPPAGAGSQGEIVWQSSERATTPYVPTSLYKDGLLYTCHDGGMIACRKAETGEILWAEKPAGRFYASPIWVGGKIYCVTREGQCVVLRAGDKYKLLGINELGEASDATPAVADGRMFIRTNTQLMCLAAQ